MARRLKTFNPKINLIFVTEHPQYAVDAFDLEASDYLLKPVNTERIKTALQRLRNPLPTSPHIRVQTFGDFEIFANEIPISFKRTKSKELLAYLIDRLGAGITKKQLAAILWEDSEYNRKTQSHLQTLVSDMMKSLKAVDADNIIIKGYDSLAVDKTKLDCDYYRCLGGDTKTFSLYLGEYMSNYSWQN